MNKIKVALYVRVSSERQADEAHYSVPEQIERLKAYCSAKGWTIYKVYTDGGQSGASIDRPALNSLILDASSKKFNMVLVYKLDRLSRRQKDTLYLIEDVFIKHNIDFTSVVENLDTSTPTGRAFIGLLSVFAQLEREQIQERMRMGKEGRAKSGKYHAGSTVSIGYDYIDGKLIVNEYEAMQIRKLFELRSKGYGMREMERYMIEHGYKHKGAYTNKASSQYDWYANTIRRVLTNKIYIGLIKHKDTYYQGEHEPIIDEELFYSIQPALQEASAKYSYSKGKYKSLLGSYIYCGNCGGRYAHYKNTVRNPERCTPTEYYGCYSRTGRVKRMVVDPTCKNKNWKMLELDALVIDEIKKLKFEKGFIESIRTNKTDDVDIQKEQIQKRLHQIDTQISKFMDLYALGTIDMNVIQDKINPLTDEKAALDKTLHELHSVKPANMDNDTIISLVDNLIQKLEDSTLDERREIIGTLIQRIEILEDDVTIVWNFY